MTTKPITEQKVLIIGAGPSGTAVLRAFKSAQDKGAEIPQIRCFEKQGDIGGQWLYNWRTGADENGQAVHSAMYRYLWSNGPKECLEFADYTFTEHFGKPIPSFPPREVLFDYIKGRIVKSGIESWVDTHTVVHSCTYDKEREMFTVTYRHLKNEGTIAKHEQHVEEFDYVFCCTGHFHMPNMPFYPGFEKFEGRILHAHNFKDAVEFKDSRILIVGASYSAEDISSQCYKYGCKDITLTYRTAPMSFTWPEEYSTRPQIQSVTGKVVTFVDGSTKEIDAIILCTGYKHHYPYFSDELHIQSTNRLWVDGLSWQNIFSSVTPRLMYIGAQDQWLTFNMFDAQAWYARDVVLGSITIPGKEEQDKQFNEWREKELKNKTDSDAIRYQTEYVAQLVEATDYPSFDYEKVISEFLEWEHAKQENIMTFRDKSHTSVMDGTKAPAHHTTWLAALDDSCECYLATLEEKPEEKSEETLEEKPEEKSEETVEEKPEETVEEKPEETLEETLEELSNFINSRETDGGVK